MTAELGFSRTIRTSVRAWPQFPLCIDTVEQAIDCVQELPPVMLKLDRWGPVSRALWAALDDPADAERLATADRKLCAALAAEGWLQDIRLV